MIAAYDEIIEFIAAGVTPQSLVEFRPSEANREKLFELIRKQKTAALSADETAELNSYLQIEHMMRMVKARARMHLAS